MNATYLRPLIVTLLVLMSSTTRAQTRENFGIGISLGFPVGTQSENIGIIADLEPRMRLSEAYWLGLRLGLAVNTQAFQDVNNADFSIEKTFDHGFLSLIPTVERHWGNVNSQRFLALGFGPYSLNNRVDVFDKQSRLREEPVIEVDIPYRFGALIRGGLAWQNKRVVSSTIGFLKRRWFCRMDVCSVQ